MQVISRFLNGEPREVELDPIEVRASEKFELALDMGHSPRIAALFTRLAFGQTISDEFLAWKAQ